MFIKIAIALFKAFQIMRHNNYAKVEEQYNYGYGEPVSDPFTASLSFFCI